MNTEYLDAVDKELFDIEDFFKDIHNPTANSAINIHPRLLPFLKFGAYSPSADESAATRSTASLASTKVEDMASERFLVDLKERYKHLKLVQDQHRIDLARLQISLRFWPSYRVDGAAVYDFMATAVCSIFASRVASTADCDNDLGSLHNYNYNCNVHCNFDGNQNCNLDYNFNCDSD
ncbi:hypothetical protein BGZ58_010988 [Dissophora ornata]|nr:hypothetical protein BGZ58_010988 [Dissophora ornata]